MKDNQTDLKPYHIDGVGKANCERILLLQGPVGPFFSELHQALVDSNFHVKRVLFNAGDQLFSGQLDCIRFSGTISEWHSWLRFEFGSYRPKAIVLFGSSRPAHEAARELATHFGIAVISLEEGYLRSGFITAEFGGNNQYSPLTNWNSKSAVVDALPVPPAALKLKSSFGIMGIWGLIYYLTRDLLSRRADEHLFHRPREITPSLSLRWCTHLVRRAIARGTEVLPLSRLHRCPGYIIVPLQVSNDSQIQKAACGWTTPRLIDACLTAVSETHPHQMVVFKLHPLERASGKIKRLIQQRARALGVTTARFKIIHTGRIGDLTAHSSGMIVINSTSAFSAMHHNVPLLVLGHAIFRHDAIVTTGETEKDVMDFFKIRCAKSPERVAEFFAAVKSHSLLPGDFYVSTGRKEAIKYIIKKIGDTSAMSSMDRQNSI